jgi:hypothetical protein
MTEIAEPTPIADTFCQDVALMERLGHCTRLTFTVDRDAPRGAPWSRSSWFRPACARSRRRSWPPRWGRRLPRPRRLARPFTDLTARDHAAVPRPFQPRERKSQ